MPAGDPMGYGLANAFNARGGASGPMSERARKMRQASQDQTQSRLSGQGGIGGMLGKLLGGSPLKSMLNF